ncbi:hypothetical protein BDB00DRAFT_760860, partial [Zychaea mexicana]|uniref:uncharacterized protein n=1 Tax=Zychaea mexicana TaxID=64656 RepID=UPI0022FEB981
KELGSKANSKAQNFKRKLSAIEHVENIKTARKMDMIFASGEVEYRPLEIGQKFDLTKELRDSRLKLPIVMKDQLLSIYHTAPKLLHNIRILGYYINGISFTPEKEIVC